jgi:transposase
MSLPATRFPLPHVGTARSQGPDPAACADPKVGGLLWGRQFGHRTIRTNDVPDLQRRHLQDFPQTLASPANARTPLDRRARQLRLLFLPPYSPQLAPIERVWKLTRRLATHNRYFATLAEVLKAVGACFDRWRRPNKVLHRLCCIT